jgi:hypothetical protein
VKAAALYADEIELVSVGAVMIAGAAQLAGGGHQALLALMASLDDDTLRHLGGGKDMPANWREVLAVLSRADASLPPEAAELARGLRESMAEAQEGLAATVEKILVDRADLGLIGRGRRAAKGSRGPAGGPAVPGFTWAAGNQTRSSWRQ